MYMETTAKTNWIHPFEIAGLGKGPFRCVGLTVMKYQACRDAPVQPGSSCDFCGTGIMNVFFIQGVDNGPQFKVGIDCVHKTHDTALRAAVAAEAKKYRAAEARKASEGREKIRQEAASVERVAFLAANPGLEDALACGHEICTDLTVKLARYGSLSSAQTELAFKLYSEKLAPALRSEVNGTAPTGPRQTIRGRIVSVKSYDSAYGTSTKMTVKVVEQRADANHVWLCWGTIPSTIEGREYGVDLRGHEIEFSASLKAGREPHFALFSRPTKARLTSATATSEEIEEEVAA